MLDATSSDTGFEWLDEAHELLRRDILDNRYPCTFGRAALRQRELYTTWAAAAEPAELARDVADFLDVATASPASRQPLVVFVEPQEPLADEQVYERRFWQILRQLHRHDDRPWPADVPDDPRRPGWQFCFHATSIFVFALVPTARRRRSRNHPTCLVLVFMPRDVFNGIEVGTAAGNTARARIRERLEAWDEVPMHPSMGERYELSDDEWRQYFLTDQDEERHDLCPFAAAGEVLVPDRPERDPGPHSAG